MINQPRENLAVHTCTRCVPIFIVCFYLFNIFYCKVPWASSGFGAIKISLLLLLLVLLHIHTLNAMSYNKMQYWCLQIAIKHPLYHVSLYSGINWVCVVQFTNLRFVILVLYSGWKIWCQSVTWILLLWWNDLHCTEEIWESTVLLWSGMYPRVIVFSDMPWCTVKPLLSGHP